MKTPIPNSYWVEPGELLAGEHPDGGTPARTRKRLAAMLKAGVRHFFDLTWPDELPPYELLLPPDASYRNFPITDHSVPDDPRLMSHILAELATARSRGGGVYVHCRAGIGRTGITVACYLRQRGAPAEQALEELNRLWQQNARAQRWPSVPETDEQLRYIHTWLPAVPQAQAQAQTQAKRQVQPDDAPSLPVPQAPERYRGCLLGLALGDALAGSAGTEQTLAWSDDTAMTLCVAESLLDHGGFDGRDQIERYVEWQRDPAAAGANPDAALRPSVRSTVLRALRSHAPLQGSHDPSVVDPAPLARSAAAALFAGGDPAVAEELAEDVARVTHQAPVAVDTCRLFAAMLADALDGLDKPDIAAAAGRLAGAPLREEVLVAAGGWESPGGRRPPAPAILAALDHAVRAFLRTQDFTSGLARLQESPGADPDATLAAFGALAGAWYGETALPGPLLEQLEGREQLTALADEMHLRTRASQARVP